MFNPIIVYELSIVYDYNFAEVIFRLFSSDNGDSIFHNNDGQICFSKDQLKIYFFLEDRLQQKNDFLFVQL